MCHIGRAKTAVSKITDFDLEKLRRILAIELLPEKIRKYFISDSEDEMHYRLTNYRYIIELHEDRGIDITESYNIRLDDVDDDSIRNALWHAVTMAADGSGILKN